jgi:uncharacterized membrane protein
MISWARAFKIRQYLKGSLWVLPLGGCIVGVGAAQFSLALDQAVQLPPGWQYSPSTASTVLATVVGAMVALLGFVVTVSVLVVQQATGTLSPRYMRLWYRDRLQKVVLASFAGTFTYAFSLLRRIESTFVPDIGVTVAGVAVATSLVLLLVYVNRFTHNLRPVAVAAAVARVGQQALVIQAEALVGEPPDSIDRRPVGKPSATIRTVGGGAIQAIAGKRLIEAAVRSDCVLVLIHGVGDFLPDDAAVIEVFGASPPQERLLRGLVATGTERTIEQDPAFAMRILVDIAIRALSPAVNDPTTAVQVIDYIEDFLHSLAALPLRPHYALTDSRGRTRLILPGRGWAEFLSLAVTEIRLYGETSPQVCRRLRAALDGLRDGAPEEHRAAISSELATLDASLDRNFTDAAGRAFAGQSDRQGIGGRSREEEVAWAPTQRASGVGPGLATSGTITPPA